MNDAVTTDHQTSLLDADLPGGIPAPEHSTGPGAGPAQSARKVFLGHHDPTSGPGSLAHHWPSWRETRLAACDATLALVPHSGVSPSTVVEEARCRRVACRREWARWFAEHPGERDADALPLDG